MSESDLFQNIPAFLSILEKNRGRGKLIERCDFEWKILQKQSRIVIFFVICVKKTYSYYYFLREKKIGEMLEIGVSLVEMKYYNVIALLLSQVLLRKFGGESCIKQCDVEGKICKNSQKYTYFGNCCQKSAIFMTFYLNIKKKPGKS